MGALTVNPADQAKRSHRLHSQSRAGQVTTTTRLADSPNAFTASTAQEPGLGETVGRLFDKFILPAIAFLFFGGLLALLMNHKPIGRTNIRDSQETASNVSELRNKLQINNLKDANDYHQFLEKQLVNSFTSLTGEQRVALRKKYKEISGKLKDDQPNEFHIDLIGNNEAHRANSEKGFLGIYRKLSTLKADSEEFTNALGDFAKIYLNNETFLRFTDETINLHKENLAKTTSV